MVTSEGSGTVSVGVGKAGVIEYRKVPDGVTGPVDCPDKGVTESSLIRGTAGGECVQVTPCKLTPSKCLVRVGIALLMKTSHKGRNTKKKG